MKLIKGLKSLLVSTVSVGVDLVLSRAGHVV